MFEQEKAIGEEFCEQCGNKKPCQCGINIKDMKKNTPEEASDLSIDQSLNDSSKNRKARSSSKSTGSMKPVSRIKSKTEIGSITPEATEKSAEELRSNIESGLTDLEKIITSLDKEKGEQAQETKEVLLSLMENIHGLYEKIDVSQEGDESIYDEVGFKMTKLMDMKGQAEGLVDNAFSEIFYDYSDFIDEAFTLKYIEYLRSKGETPSAEEATQRIYRRTPEQIEAIKSKNRELVAEKLEELAQKPYIELQDIEDLHALNNKGIVPRRFSRMRREEGEEVLFFERLGLLPADVEPEMQRVVDDINDLFDKRALGMSKTRYEMVAAKLHNDILDIHPFLDRNGSTSLMVLELMMAREGYKPSPKREKDYYRKLRKMVSNNPIAVSVVGYEQYNMKYNPGYFASERIVSDKEKKAYYDKVLDMVRGLKKRQKEAAIKESKIAKQEKSKMKKAA